MSKTSDDSLLAGGATNFKVGVNALEGGGQYSKNTNI